MEEVTTNEAWLAHHGILGQKWGIRRFQRKDGSYTTAGKERYNKDGTKSEETDEKSTKEKTPFWTEDRKRIAKNVAIGAAFVAGTALVAYGGYKMYQNHQLDPLIDKFAKQGENVVKNLAGEINEETVNVGSKKFKKISETVQEGLQQANPLKGTTEGKNNCVPSQLAGFMRDELGVDAVAKGTGGKAQSLFEVAKETFHISEGDTKRLLNPTNSMSISSAEKARATLVKRFGDNAKGVVSFTFKEDSPFNADTNGKNNSSEEKPPRVGHAIFFSIKNGIVEFRDYKIGKGDDVVSKFFADVDPKEPCTFARIDGLDPDLDVLERFVEIRK